MSAPAPFAIQHDPQVPELLYRLGVTLALSTYQAGKLVLLSAADENRLIQLPRSFDKPMGIAEDPATDRLALACREEVIVLRNSTDLARFYPKAPDRYDALYLPRATYHTGALDVHDLTFGDGGRTLYAVNTRFSCLMTVDDRHNFTPVWQPPGITALAAEDRCHLNGMALEDGRPRYATAFSRTDTPRGWRPTVTESGVLWDVSTNEVVAEGLPMPHTPRLFNGRLYLLLSATGEVVEIDRATGERRTVCAPGGFVRGMALAGEYLFVGLSKLRRESSTFGKLPFAGRANVAGIAIVHLPTGARAGHIRYLSSVDEIYDVHVLGGKRRPNILNTLTPDHRAALSTPEATYWGRLTP